MEKVERSKSVSTKRRTSFAGIKRSSSVSKIAEKPGSILNPDNLLGEEPK